MITEIIFAVVYIGCLIGVWIISKKEARNSSNTNVIEKYVINLWEFTVVITGALIATGGMDLQLVLLGSEACLFFSGFLAFDLGDRTPLSKLSLFGVTAVWQNFLFLLGMILGVIV